MPFKNLFTSVFIICTIYIFSFAQDGEIGLSGSDANDDLYGSASTVILFNEDINLNGADDVFSASVIKKVNASTYWISKGSIRENPGGKETTLLLFNETIKTAEGKDLIDQVPADNGYIVTVKNIQGTIVLYVSLADKNGNSSSDELQLKWNKEKNIFEIVNF